MESTDQIDRQKVIAEFDRRASVHGNMNAVLDAGTSEEIGRLNLLRNEMTRQSLMSLLQAGKKDDILDFGCGMGRLSHHVAKKARSVAGFDPSSEMIRVAREKYGAQPNLSFSHPIEASLPDARACFDKIFSVWVLQHIGDQELETLLRQFARLLKPGGKVVILEQTRQSRLVLSDIHIHRTREEYISLFRSAGFTCVKSKQVMRIPSYANWIYGKLRCSLRCCLKVLCLIEKISMQYRTDRIQYHTSGMIFVSDSNPGPHD